MNIHKTIVLTFACAAMLLAGSAAHARTLTPMQNNSKTDSPVIVAHRGGASLGPENSLGCIRKGLQAGADWIEIDVHLSADGHVMVCHDPSVDRTTDGSGYISAMTYAELRKLRLLDSEGKPTEEVMPTLEEVLDLLDGKASLLLEIKHSRHSREGLEQACIDIIRSKKATGRVTIQSFDDDVLFTVHELAPEIRLEKLMFFAVPALGFDFDDRPFVASYNILYLGVTESFVRKAHVRGKEVKVWTLDKFDEKTVKMVDGIITNDPGLFIGKPVREKESPGSSKDDSVKWKI